MSEEHQVNRSLQGRVAVVTGASRGIGRATAVELGELGARVVVTARTSDPRDDVPGTISETVQAIEAVGGRALAVKADLLVPTDIDRLARETLSSFGSVDILVNNAAYIDDAMFETLWEMSVDDWRKTMELNVNAIFALTKAFAPQMRERGHGLIINVSSQAGSRPPQGAPIPLPRQGGVGAAYPTSKAAVDQMTSYLGNELREVGVSMIGIDPGFVRTERAEILTSGTGFDLSAAQPMTVPAKAIGWLATHDDPLAYAGQLVVAREIVNRHKLLDL
jgi:NAD(P)-dependent dehydrogenase (short-subunit alcohol dehydrogenase family)